jgi:hypothetical protein
LQCLALPPRPAPILGNYRASLNCSPNPFGIYGNSFSVGVGTMTNCSLIYKLGRSSGQLRPKSPVLIYTSGRFSHPNLAKDGYRATYALKHDYSHANQVGLKVSFDTPRFSITESKKHQIKIPTWVGVLSLKLIATFCCDDWVGAHHRWTCTNIN